MFAFWSVWVRRRLSPGRPNAETQFITQGEDREITYVEGTPQQRHSDSEGNEYPEGVEKKDEVCQSNLVDVMWKGVRIVSGDRAGGKPFL